MGIVPPTSLATLLGFSQQDPREPSRTPSMSIFTRKLWWLGQDTEREASLGLSEFWRVHAPVTLSSIRQILRKEFLMLRRLITMKELNLNTGCLDGSSYVHQHRKFPVHHCL